MVSTLHRFKGLMRPDRPLEPGCGLTDAYCADSYEVNGDEYHYHRYTRRQITRWPSHRQWNAFLQFPIPSSNGTMAIQSGRHYFYWLWRSGLLLSATWGRIGQSKHVGITRRAFMNLKLTVAILVIAAVPLCAQAQKPSAAIVTHADARKVLENYQRRQGQDRELLRYGQARSRDGRG